MQKEKDFIRMINWMAAHPKIRRICEDEYTVTPEECIEILELLEKNAFYEMIYVLLVKNQMHDVLEQAVSRVLIESAGREWERIGMHQVCRDIRGKIREEILLKELKKGTDSPRHDGP